MLKANRVTYPGGITGLRATMSLAGNATYADIENDVTGSIEWWQSKITGPDIGSLHLHTEILMITITKQSSGTYIVFARRRRTKSDMSVLLNLSQKEREILTLIITSLFTPQHQLAINILHLNGRMDSISLRTYPTGSEPDKTSINHVSINPPITSLNTWLNRVSECEHLKASVKAVSIYLHPSNLIPFDRDWETSLRK